jgi:aspartate kinase
LGYEWPMPIVVQKYGGSSVSDVEKIRKVAQKVRAKRDAGYQVVVVVSAMGDTTDELLTLAKKVSDDPPRRELDMLLTCGERVSMALLSMALHELECSAISFTGSQSGIITTDDHSQARIVEVRPQRVLDSLQAGKVVIVAGYQGVSRNREVTTLGRGGSDTSAVALAAALNAEACEIYSDVDGIFSADPRVVPEAKKLESVSYDEMQELASAGARVLNAQAVEFAKRHGIVVHALSAHQAGQGTRIEQSASERSGVVGVTSDTNIAVISAAGIDAHALGSALGKRGLGFTLMSHWSKTGDATFWASIPLENVHGVETLQKSLSAEFGAKLRFETDLGTVTCVGTGLNRDGRCVEASLGAARSVDATVVGVHCSALQVTLVVPKASVKSLTAALHRLHIG